MMKTTRVTLLLLVTGLFAGMWSTDGTNDQGSSEQITVRRGARGPAVAGTSPHQLRNGHRPSVRLTRTNVRSCVPLPHGIAAGNYLVVDQFGSTQLRTVTASEAFPSGKIERHVAADLYTVRIGQNRWHFIRLAASTPTGLARLNGESIPAALR
jgi:hypothetical protein